MTISWLGSCSGIEADRRYRLIKRGLVRSLVTQNPPSENHPIVDISSRAHRFQAMSAIGTSAFGTHFGPSATGLFADSPHLTLNTDKADVDAQPIARAGPLQHALGCRSVWPSDFHADKNERALAEFAHCIASQCAAMRNRRQCHECLGRPHGPRHRRSRAPTTGGRMSGLFRSEWLSVSFAQFRLPGTLRPKSRQSQRY